MDLGPDMSGEENKVRVLIEKKTVLNLIDAFSVAVKHYLRGETDIYYEDLYHTTKYLPSYALPAGLPSSGDLTSDLPSPKSVSFQQQQLVQRHSTNDRRPRSYSGGRNRREPASSAPDLPLPATTPGQGGTDVEKLEHLDLPKPSRTSKSDSSIHGRSMVTLGEAELLPARDPPRYSYFDLFPFSLLVKFLTKRGKKLKGKKAALLRAKLHQSTVTQNLPLEISLYISSYIAALQNRKAIDAATTSNLILALNNLVDALTGLERILTTPIPYSYSVHLWAVTLVYCFFLPFQLWPTLKFLTIPGTIMASFIFFGFLVAGEEIENPFGYDKNDLDMDHFTNEIIRQELAAISATSSPDPKNWVFSSVNNRFINPHGSGARNSTPEEWVGRGMGHLQAALSGHDEGR
jgi:predicted membrane chloride channel (bestrophin family)